MYLNAHSYYSLRYGTLSIEELVSYALACGCKSLALTDINNSTGILPFVKACLAGGLQPIAGIEFRKDHEVLFIAIAKNNEGFREINELLTAHNIEGKEIPLRPEFVNAYVIYPFSLNHYKNLRENEFIGIRPGELNKIAFEAKRRLSRYVIHQPVVFKDRQGYLLHRQLRGIDNNILLHQLEPSMISSEDEIMLPLNKLLKLYERFPEIIQNTEKVISNCSFEFDFKQVKNRQTFTGSPIDDRKLLEKLAYDGMLYRYGTKNKEAKKRIINELEIINKLGFCSYFLITWDVIRYSLNRGFYHVGRGSGANSVVAYCLKITDVCPIELDLYFERFLNPKRKSPPDFDIDYSWKERDDVLDYIFKRYGAKYTALMGAMSTFRDKSTLRELSKLYGLPKAEIDNLIQNPDDPLANNKITKRIYQFEKLMQDFPNLRSIHAGGVLISEQPIAYYTALDMPPKGFPTAQIDMYIAEDIGFEKLDILSQRGIGHIKEAAEIIYSNKGVKIDVHEVEKFKTDEKVKEQLRSGETIGCFYVESPGMRGLLKKLKCDSYISLVAASSIIRPGVSSSGMMKEYIYRFHNPDKFKYLHPIMEQQLKETYGVMVYQEDVLKVCHHFAGLDLADADVLRRMMSGKGKSRKDVENIKAKFFSNCKGLGHTDELTKEVWRQIESFAGYSFSKAHSASYAVESFQSLYLKSHFPKEFAVAVINNFGGFYNTWVYVHEARKAGATVHLPCVNHSLYNTTIYGEDVYLGFIHIRSLESSFVQSISEEREQNGAYKDLEDFVRRTHVTQEHLVILIRVGALRFTGKSKKALLWDCYLLMSEEVNKRNADSLFAVARKEYKLPALDYNPVEDVYDEVELIGFPVSLPVFDLLKTNFRGEAFGKDLINFVGKSVRLVGNYVTTKYVRTKHGHIMNFGTWLDSNGDFFDTTHFPQSLQAFPFKGAGIYLIMGKVVEEFGFPSIEVEKMARLPIVSDPRSL